MSEQTVTIPLDKLAGLAVEHWRLATALGAERGQGGGPTVRHALRKMEDFLRACELEVRSFDRLPYDAGLSARVVDTVADSSLPAGGSVVAETVSPLVLYKGKLLKVAEVVVASNQAAR